MLCSPNEDFGRMFSMSFYRAWLLDLGYEPLKCQSKISISSFVHLPKSSFGRHKFRLTFQLFVAQVEYSHPLRGARKCGSHLLFSIPNHRLGGMDLYAPQTIILKIGTNDLFSKYFSRAWALCLGDDSFKSTSKRDTKSFVPIFKIFVWGAWFCAGWFFYNIARMGLQNTTNTRDALMIVWCFLCNNIASMGLHWNFTKHNQQMECRCDWSASLVWNYGSRGRVSW